MANEYEIAVEGRAYLLRPDTPKEGRERPQRPGETDDELSEPLRGQAKDAGLVMKPSKRTPNTLYALEATEYAQHTASSWNSTMLPTRRSGRTDRILARWRSFTKWPMKLAWMPTRW